MFDNFNLNSDLEIRQEQRLCLTENMQKALLALQLPIFELGEWLKNEILTNPLIEYEEPENYFKDRGYSYSGSLYGHEPIQTTSLFEHLMKQASEFFEKPQDLEYAKAVIGNLDERGFFSRPNSLPAFPEEKANRILQKIQEFDPPGIGARDLKECLLIQLRRENKENSLAYKIVNHHFEDLIHHRISCLEKKLNTPLAEIWKSVQHTIRSLDFKPAERFKKEVAFTIYPDVIIRQEELKWQIEINHEWLPRFRVSQTLSEHLSNYKEKKELLKHYQNNFESLNQIIRKRNQTLYLLCEQLIKKQENFFAGYTRELQPMTMQEIAKELQLHESTIARAVSQKYLFCLQGVFPLRYFFTAKISCKEGKEISNDTCKQLIAQWVKEEDKTAPLSDLCLSLKFKYLGVNCARRTVAKYRKMLRIPPTSYRRVWKKNVTSKSGVNASSPKSELL